MTEQGKGPLLEKGPRGTAIVRAYTDLKRHDLCDAEIRHFCIEQLAQGRPAQDGKPGSEFFITRKLWDVGNSAPYGHRGDLSTIAEAILGSRRRGARLTRHVCVRLLSRSGGIGQVPEDPASGSGRQAQSDHS